MQSDCDDKSGTSDRRWLRRQQLPLMSQWKRLVGLLSLRHITAALLAVVALLGLLAILHAYRTSLCAVVTTGSFSSQQPSQVVDLLSIDGHVSSATDAALDGIHIAIACDSDYYVGLLALLNSTIHNCRTPSSLRFHLVTTDEASQQFLESTVLEVFGDIAVDTVVLNSDSGQELPVAAVWAKYRSGALSKPIVYARYFFPDCFPSLSRIIYLDQDVLVVDDIRELWEADMEGQPIAAARLSRVGAEFRNQFNLKDSALLGYNEHESSLNNGVLLYDLDAWRLPDANYTEQLLAWTALNRERQLYLLGSQPPFNLVFYNKYKVLDSRWNVMDLAGLARLHTQEPITLPHADIVDAAILHWNGVLKPWSCPGHYGELWKSYLPAYQLYLPPATGNQSWAECPRQVVWTDNTRMRSGQEKFTVVLTSFMREDNLLRIVQHLRKSDFIKEVLLVWNNVNVSCPASVAALVRCFAQSDNFVHNRFSVWDQITTDAVLQHDDDILVPLDDLEYAFKLWTLHRDSILGFEPRVISCEELSDPATCSYTFQLVDGVFDLIIGKLFFVRNTYMRDFLRHPGVLELTSAAPCEDLAMNFYVGHRAKLPPVLYHANITEIKSALSAGLSQKVDTEVWRYLRSTCVSRLFELFDGKTVLPQSHTFHLDSAREFVLRSAIDLNWSWCSDEYGSRACRQP